MYSVHMKVLYTKKNNNVHGQAHGSLTCDVQFVCEQQLRYTPLYTHTTHTRTYVHKHACTQARMHTNTHMTVQLTRKSIASLRI